MSHNIDITNIDNNNSLGFAKQNREGISFKKEDYNIILKEYQKLKGITLQGKEFDPIMHEIKTMLMSNRSVADILAVMNYVANQDYIDWTIRTVKIKMPDVLAKIKPVKIVTENIKDPFTKMVAERIANSIK